MAARGGQRRTTTEARKLRALPLIKHGVPYADVANAVGCSTRSIERWVADDPRFEEAILEHAEQKRAEAERQLSSVDASTIMTLIERKQRLTAIALGQVFVEQVVRGPNGTGTVEHVGPNHMAMLKAIDQLSKIEGDYVHRVEVNDVVRRDAVKPLLAMVREKFGQEALDVLRAAFEERAEGVTLQ